MAVYFHLVASCKRKVYLKNTSKFPANYFGYTVGMNSAGSKLTLRIRLSHNLFVYEQYLQKSTALALLLTKSSDIIRP